MDLERITPDITAIHQGQCPTNNDTTGRRRFAEKGFTLPPFTTEEAQNNGLLEKLLSWFRKNFAELEKAVKDHGDFYRSGPANVVNDAFTYGVPNEHLMLIDDAMGKYVLFSQLPIVQRVGAVLSGFQHSAITEYNENEPLVDLSIQRILYAIEEWLRYKEIYRELGSSEKEHLSDEDIENMIDEIQERKINSQKSK